MQQPIKSSLVGIFLAGALYGLIAAANPVLRSLQFHDDFEGGDLSAWEFPYPEDWVIPSEGTNRFLHMLRLR